MKTKCSLPIVIMVAIVTMIHTSAYATGGVLDATLKAQGTENVASTISMMKRLFSTDNTVVKVAAVEISTKITMSWDEFTRGFAESTFELNKKYGTFPVFDANTIWDKIIPNLYSAPLDPDKMYLFSAWNISTKKWEQISRKAYKQGEKPGIVGIEEGVFFRGCEGLKGWEEPILSVWCWNFGYPNQNPVVGGAPNGNIHTVYDTLGRGGIQITNVIYNNPINTNTNSPVMSPTNTVTNTNPLSGTEDVSNLKGIGAAQTGGVIYTAAQPSVQIAGQQTIPATQVVYEKQKGGWVVPYLLGVGTGAFGYWLIDKLTGQKTFVRTQSGQPFQLQPENNFQGPSGSYPNVITSSGNVREYVPQDTPRRW